VSRAVRLRRGVTAEIGHALRPLPSHGPRHPRSGSGRIVFTPSRCEKRDGSLAMLPVPARHHRWGTGRQLCRHPACWLGAEVTAVSSATHRRGLPTCGTASPPRPMISTGGPCRCAVARSFGLHTVRARLDAAAVKARLARHRRPPPPSVVDLLDTRRAHDPGLWPPQGPPRCRAETTRAWRDAGGRRHPASTASASLIPDWAEPTQPGCFTTTPGYPRPISPAPGCDRFSGVTSV